MNEITNKVEWRYNKMPEICSFYGIAITMNYKEHNPPHFHAAYQDYEVSVEIKTGIVKGKKLLVLVIIFFFQLVS